MLYVPLILSLAGVAVANPMPVPQGVTAAIPPPMPAPSGCMPDYPSEFGIAVYKLGMAPKAGSVGQAPDGQPQASQIGDGQVQAPGVTQIDDGQIQAPAVTQIGDGQIQAPAVTQIADGQVQAPKAVTQIGDGQIQAPAATQIDDGQVQAPAATQIGDGQVQAPAATQIGDGQVQAPAATQIGDGQVQAPGGGSAPSGPKLMACAKDGTLALTLKSGTLLDNKGRTGYIAANYQFQFDAPAQTGAIYTSGFSVCGNGSLALGGSAVFYQCLSGDFYNLYDRYWAPQCEPVTISVINLMKC